MMRSLLFISLFFAHISFGQLNILEGTWQGIITNTNQQIKDGKAIWFDFKIDPSTGKITGESRIETPFTTYYAYKSIIGIATSANELSFEDKQIGSQRNATTSVWCRNLGTLVYNDSTGYLSGAWTSKDCNRQAGNIILFRSRYKMSRTDSLSLYHSWFNTLVSDLSRGWNAYYVRDAEMRDFEFVPVYFDHDKAELKPEYFGYLRKMADIVNSHTDLRIKIIGHTDSNGSDVYNVGLSERRAEQVQLFLVQAGVAADRVVIEYRGEKDPVKSNETPDGKRMNRRVDFEFI